MVLVRRYRCIIRHMTKKTIKQLKAEYDDPIAFLNRQDYQRLRKKIILGSAKLLAISIALIGIFFLPINDSQDIRYKSAPLYALIFGVWLLLFSLYRLTKVRKGIIESRRVNLRWLHPELRTLEPHKKPLLTPSQIQTIILLLLVSFIGAMAAFGVLVILSAH